MTIQRPQIIPVSGYPSLQDTYDVGEIHYKCILDLVGKKAKMGKAQEVMLELGNEHEYARYPNFYAAEPALKFKPINYGIILNYYIDELKNINPLFNIQKDINADLLHACMHFFSMAPHSLVGERMVDFADVAITGKVGGLHTIYTNLREYFSEEEIKYGRVAEVLKKVVTLSEAMYSKKFSVSENSFVPDRHNIGRYSSATYHLNHCNVGIMEINHGEFYENNYSQGSYNHRKTLVVDPRVHQQQFLYESTRPLYAYHLVKEGVGLDLTNAMPSDLKELLYMTAYFKPNEREKLEDIRGKIKSGAAPDQIPPSKPQSRINSLANAAHAKTIEDLRQIHSNLIRV